MNERIDAIKKHLVRNRKVYIAAAIGAIVGAGTVLIFIKYRPVVPGISQKAIGIWNKLIATQVFIDAPGNSGNVIQDLGTGIIYPSQNAAANVLGIDPTMISRHLSGINPDASGHIFKKIIDGGASHVLQPVG